MTISNYLVVQFESDAVIISRAGPSETRIEVSRQKWPFRRGEDLMSFFDTVLSEVDSVHQNVVVDLSMSAPHSGLVILPWKLQNAIERKGGRMVTVNASDSIRDALDNGTGWPIRFVDSYEAAEDYFAKCAL